MSAVKPEEIWTIGHSTRSIDEFIGVLKYYGIEAVADVRRFPGSRRLPQFGQDALRASLNNVYIDYSWFESLGGRRQTPADSPNTAWRNASFRGYADHLASVEFTSALNQLCIMAARRRTAIMCAEVLWWRCHRSLIADVLMAAGIKTWHIQNEKHIELHPYTQPARLYRGAVVYDPTKGEPLNNKQRQAAVQGQLDL